MSEEEGGENRNRTYSEWEVISSVSPPPEDVKHLIPPTPNAVSRSRLGALRLLVRAVDNEVEYMC